MYFRKLIKSHFPYGLKILNVLSLLLLTSALPSYPSRCLILYSPPRPSFLFHTPMLYPSFKIFLAPPLNGPLQLSWNLFLNPFTLMQCCSRWWSGFLVDNKKVNPVSLSFVWGVGTMEIWSCYGEACVDWSQFIAFVFVYQFSWCHLFPSWSPLAMLILSSVPGIHSSVCCMAALVDTISFNLICIMENLCCLQLYFCSFGFISSLNSEE